MSIVNNDQFILHLDIKDEVDVNSKITYDVLKNEYKNENKQISNVIFETLNEQNKQNEHKVYVDQDQDQDENDILYDYIENNEIIAVEELYEKRLESRLIQDNLLIKNLENLHKDDNLLNKLVNKMNKQVSKQENITNDNNHNFDKVLNNFFESNMWINNTDVCCWWCCHKFDTIPIGYPIHYDIKSHKFRVKGVYCSFSCMLAHNDPINTKSKSLIYFLYTKLTGGDCGGLKNEYIKSLQNDPNLIKLFDTTDKCNNKQLRENYINSISSFIDEPLKKAPPLCTLKMFGGKLSIEEFRNASQERKVYKMIEYPMFICRDYVEEVDLEKLKTVNKTIFNNNNDKIKHDINIDIKKIEDAKNRIKETIVEKQFGIDQFIK